MSGTRTILDRLHVLMTGKPIPMSDTETNSALVCTPGIGALDGVWVALGSDRIRKDIPNDYMPLIMIDDGDIQYEENRAVYEISIKIGVLVPGRLGALFGYEESGKRVFGIIDLADAVIELIEGNEMLMDSDGFPAAQCISGVINLKRDIIPNKNWFVGQQFTAISLAYQTKRKARK